MSLSRRAGYRFKAEKFSMGYMYIYSVRNGTKMSVGYKIELSEGGSYVQPGQ